MILTGPRPAVGLLLAVLAVAAVPAAETDAYSRGSRLLKAGDYDGAAAALREAVRQDPRLENGWLKLGMAHAARLDWAGAEEAYRRLLELDPRHPQALNNLANVYFRRGLYPEAAEWYERALAVEPDYLLAAFHYGWILRQLNRPEEAERAFAHVLELPAENDRERKTRVDALYYVGTLRFRAGDHARAAECMEQVLQVSPGNVEARYYLGMSYRQLGRIEDAKRELTIHARLLEEARRDEPVAKDVPRP